MMIQNYTQAWAKCMNKTDSDEGNVCTECLNSYNMIANQYSLLKKGSNGVCFEITDQVNSPIGIFFAHFHLLTMLI